MVTIPKLFSVLVASGNGERCDELKRVVRAKLRANDRVTGKSNQFLFNEGKDLFKKIIGEYVKNCPWMCIFFTKILALIFSTKTW